MTLEETITTLTARTPSGGICRIGDASFNVYYSPDCWEWEYQGITYFDPKDLAEALQQNLGYESKQAMYRAGLLPERRKVTRLAAL